MRVVAIRQTRSRELTRNDVSELSSDRLRLSDRQVRVDYAVFSGKWAMGRVHQLGDGAEPLKVVVVAVWRPGKAARPAQRWTRRDP